MPRSAPSTTCAPGTSSDAGDAGVAPLGNDDAGRHAHGPCRAVHGTSRAPTSAGYVAEHGGEVVSDVDERWTRSPAAHESIEA